MLQIKNIKKEYNTHGLVQKALDDVSLNFRSNEFVAVLGPSGSGKTTLLNVIGGLDRYDSGDLIINDVSTKKYKDRDWDSYRNHTIGFVFQSYNLIPHQSVLQNVELALTISGISKEERRKKAVKALEEVGLSEHINKTPNQLSGGQMQRVAIARALVNDPDILLADEPTGALDSETGIQVMDLLKKVAKNHLVIMVTHNPELAQQYATRIVELKDGKIISDSQPFVVEEEEDKAIHKNLGKASMNFLTALSLSFNNLKTKLPRTLLVAFAGSIGIIGIAMILSLSTGVNNYIDGIEKDTIRKYPLTISKTGFDISSMFSINTGDNEKSDKGGSKKSEAQVKELQTITNMFSVMNSNDLKALKKEIDKKSNGINKHSRAIEYSYSAEPQLFTYIGDKYRQVNPDQTRQKMGFSFSQAGVYNQMVSSNVFHPLPKDKTLYEDEYDVKAGRWPKKYNELVVVLQEDGSVSDLALYAMGLKDMDELDKMLEKFASGKTVKVKKSSKTFTYKDLMEVQLKLVNSSDYYTYDSGNGVWVDHSKDIDFLQNTIEKGEDVKVVGVVKPKPDQKFTVLAGDIFYPDSMVKTIMARAQDSDIVKAQQKDKNINVLTGKAFGKNNEGPDLENIFAIDQDAMSRVFQFDTSKLKNGMNAPSPKVSNLGSLISPSEAKALMPKMSNKDVEKLIRSANLNVTDEEMQKLFQKLLNGFLSESAAAGTDYTKVQEGFNAYLASPKAAKIISDNIKSELQGQMQNLVTKEDMQKDFKDVLSGFPEYLKKNVITEENKIEDVFADSNKLQGAIEGYLGSSEVSAKVEVKMKGMEDKLSKLNISGEVARKTAKDLLAGFSVYSKDNGIPDVNNLPKDFNKYLKGKEAQALIATTIASGMDTKALEKEMAKSMENYSSKAVSDLTGKVMQGIMTNAMTDMGKGIDFSQIFKIDTDAFAKAMNFNMDEKEIKSLMQSMMNTSGNNYESNMAAFGYATEEEPTNISIYAKDFESKGEIKTLLDKYNKRMKAGGEKEKAVTYSDIAGTLMGSVSDIINAISYVLIAFVSISLVVSSIMIGVITYISVLERRKEIGILRAIGASKKNVARVFNAETFIIGGLAGAIGIITTELLIIPTNLIIKQVTDANVVAYLPPKAAASLVALSVILTLIGGLLPSRKAAKSDPVTALRVE